MKHLFMNRFIGGSCVITMLLLLLLVEVNMGLTLVSSNKNENTEVYVSKLHEATKRRRRSIADVLVTNKNARRRNNHMRQAFLYKILSTIKQSVGGKCACLLAAPGLINQKCSCNSREVFNSLLHLFSSPKKNKKKIKVLLSTLTSETKQQVLQLAFRKVKSNLHKMVVEKRRLKRLRHRALHRRYAIRKHPRSAFDGKQLISF